MTTTAPESSLDRHLAESHYWRFTPSGIAVPGFFETIDWTDQEREEFWEAHRARFAGMEMKDLEPYLFSYEAEHRRQPICTVAGAYGALERISAEGYDTSPGDAIKVAREAAVASIHHEQLEAARQKMSGTYEARWEAELLRKSLPTDPQANLELMRLVLGMPQKLRAET